MESHSRSVCVIIGDIHFTVETLELAKSSVTQAMNKAKELNVPLVLNGDILDGKAAMRGECVNCLLELQQKSKLLNVKVYVNVGNHDLINHHSSEHTLNFLKSHWCVIDSPTFCKDIDSYIIPYQTTFESLQNALQSIPQESRIIIHQGVQTAFMGHYIQDKTSLDKQFFADYRVIASHYHRRQDIKCGRPRKGAVGLFSYIGSPYSITFSEASDGLKGFSILMENGLLEHIPTNLRKHVVVERTIDNVEDPIDGLNPTDRLWLKVIGSTVDLDKLDKKKIGMRHLGHSDFKLDPIPFSSVLLNSTNVLSDSTKKTNDYDLLDNIIDLSLESNLIKTELKSLWRELLSYEHT